LDIIWQKLMKELLDSVWEIQRRKRRRK